MKKFILFIALFLSFRTFAQTTEKNFIDQNYIEVTGIAEMEIVPDQIYMKIILNEKDLKPKSLHEVELTMIAKLRDLGIDISRDLVINNFTSIYRNEWILKTDIQLSKAYQLLLHDGETTAKVFAELKKMGIANVFIEGTDHSKILEYKNEVKKNAIVAARDKAKDLTSAIGQEIGKAIYIQELNVNNNYFSKRRSGFVSETSNSLTEAENEAGSDLEFQKIRLVYSILVRFELK